VGFKAFIVTVQYYLNCAEHEGYFKKTSQNNS